MSLKELTYDHHRNAERQKFVKTLMGGNIDPKVYAEFLYNQYVAFTRGKNVVLTMENPNKNETNKRFIRVNARDVWKSAYRSK